MPSNTSTARQRGWRDVAGTVVAAAALLVAALAPLATAAAACADDDPIITSGFSCQSFAHCPE